MTKLRLLAALAAAFAAGVAFVVACGDDAPKIIDAGSHADAAACGQCEPSIDSTRIYQVRQSGVEQIDQVLTAAAACEEGDILLGGGCWVYRSGGTTRYDSLSSEVPLIASGPRPPLGTVDPGAPTQYECVYPNLGSMSVWATAICFKPLPPQ